MGRDAASPNPVGGVGHGARLCSPTSALGPIQVLHKDKHTHSLILQMQYPTFDVFHCFLDTNRNNLSPAASEQVVKRQIPHPDVSAGKGQFVFPL